MIRVAFAAALLACHTAHAAAPIPVVAAETVYGDIARQIGGDAVSVTSILSNPDQDPHLFEASPSVARAVSAAKIVIVNGIGYDPWMDAILRAARSTDRQVIVVGDVSGHHEGDNPHLWYDMAAVRATAAALEHALAAADSPRADVFAANFARFDASLAPIDAKIAALRARGAGTPVAATEPVFGYAFAALGLDVRESAFAQAVMNGTEPAASDVARFETDLRTGTIKLLVFNAQAKDPIAERMERIARAAHVPVVGVTETEPAKTEPAKTGVQEWLLGTLDAVDAALPR